jgi:hydrogenase expression/formation protein HypC
MCLGLPGQIIELKGQMAVIDFYGLRKDVRIDTTKDTLLPGDFVIAHAGAVVRRVEPEEVFGVLGMYEVVLAEGGEDPILLQES